MKSLILISILAFFTFATRGVGFGQDIISVGPVELALGMSEDAVMSMLKEQYGVSEIGKSSIIIPDPSRTKFKSYMVVSKGDGRGAIASVAFSEGKLKSVIRYWGPRDQQRGAEFARSVYGVIAEFVRQGKRICRISVGEDQVPDAELKTAFIVCGIREIRIDLTRTEDGNFASVSDILREP